MLQRKNLIKISIIILFCIITFIAGRTTGIDIYKKFSKPLKYEDIEKNAEDTIKKSGETDINAKDTEDDRINKVRVLYVRAEKLNLREKRELNSKVLNIMIKGDIVEPLDNFGKWVRIQTTSGIIGWCYRKYLGYKNVPENQAVFPEIKRINIESEYFVKNIIDKLDDYPYGVVSSKKLNIRAGYSSAYQEVDVVYKGDILRIYGYQNGWFKVESPTNIKGWATAKLIDTIKKIDKPNNKIIYSKSSELDSKFNIKSYLLVTRDKTNIRLEPDFSGGNITQVDRNKTLKAVTLVNNWYFVIVDQNIAGWVNQNYVMDISGSLYE